MDYLEVKKKSKELENNNTTISVINDKADRKGVQYLGNANSSSSELYGEDSSECLHSPSWSGMQGSDTTTTTTDEEQGQLFDEEVDNGGFDDSHSSSEDQLCKEFDIEIVFAEDSLIDKGGSIRERSSSSARMDERKLCRGHNEGDEDDKDDDDHHLNITEKCHHLTINDDEPSECYVSAAREVQFPKTDIGWCEEDDIEHKDSTRLYTFRMKPNQGLRSILKSQEEIQPVLERRHSVCFSDVLGMVRCFGEGDPVACVGSTPLRQSRFEWSFAKSRNYRESLELSEKQMVVLHDLSFMYPELKGVVYIRNLAYEKHVYVRYSCDQWRTFNEVEATYDYGIYGKLVDQYVFTINLESEFMRNDEILVSFALRFECRPCDIFWDNNNGENYYARLIYRAPPHKDHIVYDLIDNGETSLIESNEDKDSDEKECEDQEVLSSSCTKEGDGKRDPGSNSTPPFPFMEYPITMRISYEDHASHKVDVEHESNNGFSSWHVKNLVRTKETMSFSDPSKRITTNSSNPQELSTMGSSFLSNTSDSYFTHDWNTPEFIRKWKTSDFLDVVPGDLSLRG